MSWRKLALVQLVQKVFMQKSTTVTLEKEEVLSEKKSDLVQTIDTDKKDLQQATLKDTVQKSLKNEENNEKPPQALVQNSTTKSKEQEKAVKKSVTQKKETLEVKKESKETSRQKAKKTSTKTSQKSAKSAPSKKQQKLKLYHEDIKKHLGSVDDAFLEIIVKNLGPSIYRKDAESVACSDPKELETVKNNFLVKKLQMPKDDKEALDKAVAEVCEKLKGVKTKYRATFYYMLAKNLKKESMLS